MLRRSALFQRIANGVTACNRGATVAGLQPFATNDGGISHFLNSLTIDIWDAQEGRPLSAGLGGDGALQRMP